MPAVKTTHILGFGPQYGCLIKTLFTMSSLALQLYYALIQGDPGGQTKLQLIINENMSQ